MNNNESSLQRRKKTNNHSPSLTNSSSKQDVVSKIRPKSFAKDGHKVAISQSTELELIAQSNRN